MCWKTGVLPVKWTPARCGDVIAGLPTDAPRPGTKLITPGGRPAASNSRIRYQLLRIDDDAGFHSTVLPISAGAVGRFPAIDVKLKGVTANTKPSSARYSRRFHCPGALHGCSG